MDQIKIAILTQHLPYELDMFDEATAYLQSKEFEQSVNVTERGTAWFKKMPRSKCSGHMLGISSNS